ncbi:MFS transporter [Halalkalibacter oceani]|uniref:MFS transporter n=1 Tax=Halalkalibacter oceani TaxID=1653776 RepID=UPI00339870B8
MLPSHFFRKYAIYGGLLFFAINGMVQPFFTLYAQEIGASTAAIGFMVTLRALLPIFIALPSGQLIDSIGPMKMLIFGCFLLVLSLFTTFIATGLWTLALSQLLLGASMVITTSSFQVMVSEGDKRERDGNIKKYSMGMSAGGMIGPLLGGLIVSLFATDLIGYRMSFLFSTAVAAIWLFGSIVLSRYYPHPDPAKAAVQPRELLKVQGVANSYVSGVHLTKNRAVQFGLIGTFLIMYIQAIYMSFMPLYLHELGYGTWMISIIIAEKGLSGILAMLLLGWVMKHAQLERILITAGMIAAVCVAITPLVSFHIGSIILLVLVMGAAVGINMPVSMMIMVNHTKDADRGKVMGLRLLMNRFSQVISPAAFGLLGHTLGLTAAFYTGGIFLVSTMCGFSIFSSRKLKLTSADGANKQQQKRVRAP